MNSAISLPETNYPLFDSLPARLVDEGLLSKLQLEGIMYACSVRRARDFRCVCPRRAQAHAARALARPQKHCEFLPDGVTRAGFFIGDGAGVGKGRQVSGIILDSYARGRRQHLWVSTSTDLVKDAERDLRDLGIHIKARTKCMRRMQHRRSVDSRVADAYMLLFDSGD